MLNHFRNLTRITKKAVSQIFGLHIGILNNSQRQIFSCLVFEYTTRLKTYANKVTTIFL